MQIVNHDVVTAFKHWSLCREVYDRFYHSPRKATTLRVDICEALLEEVAAAERAYEDTLARTYMSQKKFEDEVAEIKLDQIGLDL